ncbi:MAG TPA: helix-turn-helix domain-containing protein [Sandaracinaceae bacterium LLY-WYZ-13_1]|nr:helix-turn-helix domain-containing protein [Sandaracinaceae bacterium LLY-WYZ-13_1]
MESLGSYLRNERELRQISLEEIAQTTRIPLRMLQHIEEDDLDALPGEVFARGFIKSYARSVGLDADEVLSRFGEPEPEDEAAPAPITAITPPERGRRFGIAIALVILLILFTLALSIVLRPRHRDTPIELSDAVHSVEAAPASLV